ncbi:MAG: YhjD/YihY/BrkB family envelope integrity protein [Desulfuromonadaceae bacterium]|nr:YhjD/YihY/BrkB family envelope integrity protein [Desulfuromonadaceae bacterium]MDD2847903.1 YhjD/YihY/BrkB family envelope integrity protein [Desulfuromonadaceae bacterium]MDD4129552.1 YhjD/YihY/BrkB family envelope integrity protein [Desulfuromonadaceae bacterium]
MHNLKIPALFHTENPEEWYGLKGRLFSLIKFVYFISVNFTVHQGFLRAAALTYTTVLSLVPFLAIAFSVLKGLGAQNALEPILQQVAGDSEETISRIIDYVNNTNVKSLGAIGLVMLILTVISLMGNIEEAFNSVWGVRETRSVQRRFSDYLSVVIVGPILLLAATSMTSSLQSQWVLQWLIQNTYLGDAILLLFRFLPYLSVSMAMVFLYLFIPNTRVRIASAVTGGVMAGTAWELAQWGYFHFQVGVAKYNAIYGTLAAVPIFLVWIYTSWLIVLFGLEIVFVHQHRGHSFSGNETLRLTATAREELAIALLVQVNLHFKKSGVPPSAQSLADELNVPLLPLEGVFSELERLGFLVPTAGSVAGWLPSRDPSEVQVCDVIGALRGIVEVQATTPVLLLAENVLRQAWDGSRAKLEGVTVRDLLVKAVL